MEVIDSTVANSTPTNVQVVSVVEAKKHFSHLMARVAYSGERLVVERHGKPVMAWVSVEDLQRLEAFERKHGSRLASQRAGKPLPDSTEILYQLRENHFRESEDLC
jgi:prevent-host-death family protein